MRTVLWRCLNYYAWGCGAGWWAQVAIVRVDTKALGESCDSLVDTLLRYGPSKDESKRLKVQTDTGSTVKSSEA